MGRFGQGELYPTMPSQLQTQQEEIDLTLLGLHFAGGYYSATSAWARATFLPPPLHPPGNSTNEKAPDVKFPMYSNALLVYSNLPNVPLFSLKEKKNNITSPLFPGLTFGFATVSLSQVIIRFYSWTNPSFAGKITSSFLLFNVNSNYDLTTLLWGIPWKPSHICAQRDL